jgi:hypothetical protein
MIGFRSLSLVCSEVPQRYPQMDMYNDCLRRHGPRHRYLAFIDVDEVRRLPQTIGVTICCQAGCGQCTPPLCQRASYHLIDIFHDLRAVTLHMECILFEAFCSTRGT